MNSDCDNAGAKTVAVILAAFFCLVVSGIVPLAVAQDDVADVRSKEFRLDEAGKLRYLLIGAKGDLKAPADGFKLLVVLPGGDGGSDFEPFVKRIHKNALSGDYLVVQLIAPKWTPRQEIIWPTAKASVRGASVPTEEFIAKAVADVGKRARIDRRRVFTLSWSSGGPAAYAASLAKDTPVTGSFVAMSVFKPARLDLTRAKGRLYYILHSPEDQVCPHRMAVSARDELGRNGATVELVEYPGGHGWRGDVFGNVRAGVEWLEDHVKADAKMSETDQ